MRLLPGCTEEYIRRHDHIWPELKELLRSSGVKDYTIFLDEETGTLFGVQKTESAAGSQNLGAQEIVRKWWAYMSDLMETHPDQSPVSIPLIKVFHMD
jgi:L-rhamnose mutarotase